MRASNILQNKGNSAITILPMESVEMAVRMFKENKIGAIIVPSDNLF